MDYIDDLVDVIHVPIPNEEMARCLRRVAAEIGRSEPCSIMAVDAGMMLDAEILKYFKGLSEEMAEELLR